MSEILYCHASHVVGEECLIFRISDRPNAHEVDAHPFRIAQVRDGALAQSPVPARLPFAPLPWSVGHAAEG